MAPVYEFIGRTVVRVVWWRFGRQIQIAGIGLLFVGGVIGFLLSRKSPPEG
jgi:hypothetical protein